MTTLSNAGPPPRPFEPEPRWVFAVECDPADTYPGGLTRLSWGTRTARYGETADIIATTTAAQTRISRPTYTGTLHVWVWAGGEGDHYRDPVPDYAEYRAFPPGTPPPPDHPDAPDDSPEHTQ